MSHNNNSRGVMPGLTPFGGRDGSRAAKEKGRSGDEGNNDSWRIFITKMGRVLATAAERR